MIGRVRLSVAVAALLGVSALFGGSLYDAVVLAPNLRGGPIALEHGRLFMAEATPANLFRVLSPSTQGLLLLALLVNWTDRRRRWPLAGALAALVLCDAITFNYHYPRNRLLFTAPLTVGEEILGTAARQWAAANLVRVALVLGAWLGTLVAVLGLVGDREARPAREPLGSPSRRSPSHGSPPRD